MPTSDRPETKMRALARAATQGEWGEQNRHVVPFVGGKRASGMGFGGCIAIASERADAALIAHMHPARVDALAAVVEAARETFGYHSPACPALALRLRCTCGSDALRAAFSDLAALDGAAPGEAAPQCTSSDMWCDVSARTTADG